MRPNKENMGIWVKIKILEKVQGTVLIFFMIRTLFSLIYLKPQTKYETAQPSSASAFELIRKDAFKSHIALRIIRR